MTSLMKNRRSIFDLIADDILSNFDSMHGFERQTGRSRSTFPVNFELLDDSYRIAALIGAPKDNVKLSVKDEYLVISADQVSIDKDSKMILREFGNASITRSIALPSDSNIGQIDADYSDGILTVTIPRLAGSNAEEQEIKIK